MLFTPKLRCVGHSAEGFLVKNDARLGVVSVVEKVRRQEAAARFAGQGGEANGVGG
jgi:hypothetical protein